MGSGRQTEEGYTSGQLRVVMEVSAQQEELLVHQFPGMESSSSPQHNHSHLQSHTRYQYAHVFPFEDRFDQRVAQGWVQEHWVPMTAWAGSVYIILVFSGQAWMASRPAYQLRGPLTAWSAFLAIFSIIGFLRVLPEFLHTLTYGGLYKSICDPSFIHSNKVSGYWTWLFTLSKMPELGDTVFIVLRKQQLIFLHWYHHLTVLIYVFYCFSQFTSCARWFMVMNYFVHSLMYSYYALRAMKVKVPRGVAMSITSLQLLQMVVGCVINYLAFQFKRSGAQCGVSDSNLMYSSLMYASYFVLFARFFHNAYFNPSSRKVKEKLVNGISTDNSGKFENDIKFNQDYSNKATEEYIKEDTKENTEDTKNATTKDTKKDKENTTNESTEDITSDSVTKDTKEGITDDTENTEKEIHSTHHGDEMMIWNGEVSGDEKETNQEDEDKKLK